MSASIGSLGVLGAEPSENSMSGGASLVPAIVEFSQHANSLVGRVTGASAAIFSIATPRLAACAPLLVA